MKAIQRMLGHASAAMTLDVYAGLFPEELDELAVRMEVARREDAAKRAAAVNTVAATEAVVIQFPKRASC